MYIHKGNDLTSFGGCKGVCKSFEKNGKEWNGQTTFYANEITQNTINSIRELYDNNESNLTGSKFLLLNNSTAPQANKKPKVTQKEAIRLLNQAGGVGHQ